MTALTTGVPSISQIAGLAVVVLPQDVGLAVAVEVAGSLTMPGRPGIGRRRRRAARSVPSISQIAGRAVVVLPQDVGLAVAVEVAGSRRRARSAPGLADGRCRRSRSMPSISQIAGLAVVVLPQDVGLAVAVEIAGVLDVPGRARIDADAGHRQ